MNSPARPKALAILGPTASGKTSFAVALARAFRGEIVGVDSRQVYKGLDVGSGKDLAEYSSGGEPVPFHLIDIVEPSHEYNLAEFHRDATEAVREILSRGRFPVLAGGTALYLNSLLRGYALPGGPPDPALRERLGGLDAKALCDLLEGIGPGLAPSSWDERNNRARLLRRIELSSAMRQSGLSAPPLDAEFLVLGVRRDRKEAHRRIEARLDARFNEGMVEEVARLHDAGLPWARLESFGLEYRHLAWHLQGRLSLQEARDALLAKIRQFAKRQDSWFRKMEREGLPIHWFEPSSLQEAASLVSAFLSGEPLPAPAFQLKDVMYGPAGQP